MFDTGKLIEEGSHDELIAQNGKYAEMFRVQSQKYKENYESV
jgi:ABC-type multidrug transport system fused ATPase/permease subunit